MLNRRPTFWRSLILLTLLLSVPLCCCRVGLAISILSVGPDDATAASDATAMLAISSCCAGEHGTPCGDADSEGEPDDQSPAGCRGLCCLKGYTLSPEVELPSADLLSFILPVELSPNVERLGQVDPLTTDGDAGTGPPPDDPAAGSLVQRRCLLLI